MILSLFSNYRPPSVCLPIHRGDTSLQLLQFRSVSVSFSTFTSPIISLFCVVFFLHCSILNGSTSPFLRFLNFDLFSYYYWTYFISLFSPLFICSHFDFLVVVAFMYVWDYDYVIFCSEVPVCKNTFLWTFSIEFRIARSVIVNVCVLVLIYVVCWVPRSTGCLWLLRNWMVFLICCSRNSCRVSDNGETVNSGTTILKLIDTIC